MSSPHRSKRFKTVLVAKFLLGGLFLLSTGPVLGGNSENRRSPPRTWTDTTGRKLEARFDGFEAENAIWLILANGQRAKVELDRLSEKDQEYLKSLAPEPTPGEIVDYPAHVAEGSEEAKFLDRCRMRQLAWRGEDGAVIPFLLYVPVEARREDTSPFPKKFPMIVHLSGNGGLGKDNAKALFHDAGACAKNYMDANFQRVSPCFIMIPQTATAPGWSNLHKTLPAPDLQRAVHAIDHLLADEEFRIDPARLYVTGLSMGGSGAFQAMAKFPDKFAAGIPIAYTESPLYFDETNTRKDNLWLVVNRGDKGTPEAEIDALKARFREFGGRLKVTVFDQKGHDAWTKLLEDQEFRNWLFSKRLP